ncbi:hypothetical protein [Paenibacillus harenae]|uniref:hypothetical protein n=1 Tax=Paenibacillus harenae TaxID=306543 RepID=UPI0027946AF7|nr:hypothetical protein [Paenibacillus harenae]MDQ0060660.1 hypothetical protein [Paenibacillus harenae]
MINSMEDQIRFMLRQERQELNDDPDYDAMWRRIESKLSSSIASDDVMTSARVKKPLAVKIIPIACAAVLLAAAPAMAGVTIDWGALWRGESISDAISHGLGEELQETVVSGNIPFTITGVAADDYFMNVLFQLDLPPLADNDYIVFESVQLTNKEGREFGVESQLRADASATDSLIGVFQAENKLGGNKEHYDLKVNNLKLYKYRSFPLGVNPLDALHQPFALPYALGTESGLEVTNVIRSKGKLVITYEIDPVSHGEWQPAALSILTGSGDSVGEEFGVVLRTVPNGRVVKQSTFVLSDAELADAELAVTTAEVVSEVKAEWRFSFNVDRNDSLEAIYVNRLNEAVTTNDALMRFKELVVTPIDIRLPFDEDPAKSAGGAPYPRIEYEKQSLIIDGLEVEGWLGTPDLNNRYFSFQPPEWYDDWSQVPITLKLSERLVTDLNDKTSLIALRAPSSERQRAETRIGSFKLHIDYYMDGDDLITETSSEDRRFRSVTPYLYDEGKKIVPQFNPAPPSGNGTGIQVDRYTSAPKGDLELRILLYEWSDPDASTELNLQ